MPPMATATKPDVVKKSPESNCSDVMGATSRPLAAPIAAARPNDSSIMRLTSTPIRLAAIAFSAQAWRARPSCVR